MCQADAKKRTEIQKTETHYGGHRPPTLERKHGKEVLGEIVDDAESALRPAEGNQILAKNITLREPRVLDYLAQLHIVEHFHAQSAIGADRVIDRAPDHIESAHTHVVPRFRVGNFPRAVSENEKRLKESDHHFLARPLHDHAREKDDMIGSLSFGIGNSAPQRIGFEEYIRIGEEQPVPTRLLAGHPHGMRFAEPPRGQFRNVDDLQQAMCLGARRNLIHNLSGAVRRTIIDGDNFIVGIIEGEQLPQRLANMFFLVARRNNNADSRLAVWSRWPAIPFGPRDVGDMRHTECRFHDARKPGQCEDAACDPMNCLPMHSARKMLLRELAMPPSHPARAMAGQIACRKTELSKRRPLQSPAKRKRPATSVYRLPIPSS